MKNFLLGCAALAIATAPVIAQETIIQQAEIMAPSVEKIEINEDGSLTGKVYAKVASEETPVDAKITFCLLYTSPSPRDATLSRMPSSA